MSSKKKALLIGGTGAIGVYLSALLIEKGYQIHVTTRSTDYKDKLNLIYIVANGHDTQTISTIIKQTKYDTIVDFMDYTTDEFKERYGLFLKNTKQYILLSTCRVYADSEILTEKSPRLLDVSTDTTFISTDDYALRKARQEDILTNSSTKNWTIVRPGITYSKRKFQFGPLESEIFLRRAIEGLSTPFPKEMLNKLTTMTWAGDVALMISKLVNNKEAYGKDFITATSDYYSWEEVLKIYNSIIPMNIMAVPIKDFLDTLKGEGLKYQVLYDRMFNRRIDNRKVLDITGIKQGNLTSLKDGLYRELIPFIDKPHFNYLNIEKHNNLNKLVEKVKQDSNKMKGVDKVQSTLNHIKNKTKLQERLKKITVIRKQGKLFFYMYKKVYLSLKSRKKKVYVFGMPYHSNLGDLAQTYCIERLYKKMFPGTIVVSIDTKSALANDSQIIKMIREKISPSDKVVLHSGHHTTDIWPKENELNLLILNLFPNFPITVLPQTIHFEDEKNLISTAEQYDSHGSVLLMCRDEVSFKTAKKFFKNTKLVLMPDIVTTLVGEYRSRSKTRDGILMCFRNDKESKHGSSIGTINTELKKITNRINLADTTLDLERYLVVTKKDRYINKFLAYIANHKLVVTDRYHGTIFSVITNTPVIVLGSTDHKLSSGVKWFANKAFKDRVYYAESPDEAIKIAKNIYGKHDFSKQVPPLFNEKYWDKIKGI